ncbi:MAG: diaminopimelate epimerase [Natronospirillum sp.]
MRLRFTKMHGLGNDFMVIDGVTQEVQLSPEQVRAWGDRRFGIGFDQLLLVEPPTRPDVAFQYRIFNADGTEVEQCGNGARCFAAFVRRQGLTADTVIAVQTSGGRLTLEALDDGMFRVNMGIPRLQPADVPITVDRYASTYGIALADGSEQSVTALSMGNPHAVLMVNDVNGGVVERLGPELERHPQFPARVNVGFLQVLNRQKGRLRVYERGVGETLACGSGACAALVAARLRDQMDSRVTLHLNGGQLQLEWNGDGEAVYMTGPAAFVYDGEISLDDQL